jgi:hypothetical protein
MSEKIWTGRVHLGDDPGIYGNAQYVGFSVAFPVQLQPFDETAAAPPPDVTFLVAASDVSVMTGYPGHKVSIVGYSPTSTPHEWAATELAFGRINSSFAGELVIQVSAATLPEYLSVHVEIDATVAPGLYDDFLLTRISLQSTTHYASFGFRFRPTATAADS